MDFAREVTFLVLLICILIALIRNQKSSFQNADHLSGDSRSLLGAPSADKELQADVSGDNALIEGLKYDYYSESCTPAEQIIKSTVQKLFKEGRDVAPALLRLVFHDCFIEGCDASVLLDPVHEIQSEKNSPPNQSLNGFDAIDSIKSELEIACPGIVSCADILVLAAREAVLLVGGPFYPLLTGRKDSAVSYRHNATFELPGPDFNLSQAINSFATRGFNERETVSLLGAHSTGTVHCSFFNNRLFNFNGTGAPDPSIDPEFLEVLRSKCNSTYHSLASSSPSPSGPPSGSPSAQASVSPSPGPSSNEQEAGMRMDYEGPGKGFGSVYYRGLSRNRGLLFVDQQMTSRDDTKAFVQEYATSVDLFRRDFALSMMKLSNLKPITAPMGQVRLNCRKVN